MGCVNCDTRDIPLSKLLHYYGVYSLKINSEISNFLLEMYKQNFLGGRGRRCLRLTLPPSCADCLEIWEPQPLGTLRACSGLLWDSPPPPPPKKKKYEQVSSCRTVYSVTCFRHTTYDNHDNSLQQMLNNLLSVLTMQHLAICTIYNSELESS
jgi:hypothetical protein